MPDRGMNAVEPESSIVDTVLTPRLAARFERALALDEADGGRAPNRERNERLGPGLFEIAIATRRAPATVAAAAAAAMSPAMVVDPASRRALASAAFACGAEMVATIGERDLATITDVAGEARLARASALPMAALLEEVIAATAEVAARVGDDAALAWFVATARRLDPRIASVTPGVIANVPAAVARAEPSFAERFERARETIAAQRRAIERVVELRASRDEAIAAAGAAARAATMAAISEELAARVQQIERTRVRELAAIDRWYAQEQPLRVSEAYVARDAALAAAERIRRADIEAAHDEHVTEIARHHARTMDAIAREQSAYDDAVAHRFAATDAVRARWERELASIERIEDPEIRQRLAQTAMQRLTNDVAAANAQAGVIEARAREERDSAVADAEADETAARERDAARYEERVANAERRYAWADENATSAPRAAEQALMRAASARRAAVEATASAATRDAHARAEERRARDADEAATAAARARAAEIDNELAMLDRVARGAGDDAAPSGAARGAGDDA